MATEQTQTQQSKFPPVVTVLGHVDHGKTTLLDAMRLSSIADREFGGITQKIGASSVEIMHDNQKRQITFIDTPGHEAFTAMRSRGAQAADIGILVVSVADGVMPQTKESIHLLFEAKLPFVVALTKADVENKMTEKVKQQLLKEQVLLEGLGGDIPYIEVSARTGLHIKELLDLVILSFDLLPASPELSPDGQTLAIVIESKRDIKAGAKATVVIKNGTLKVRNDVTCDEKQFKIRSLINTLNIQITSATIGEAVEVLGMSEVLSVGSLVTDKQNAVIKQKVQVIEPMQRVNQFMQKTEEPGLSLIVCADTEGSLEAITYALPKDAVILSKKTGEVSEADILLAKSTGSIVISFNTKIRPDVQRLALTEKVLAKNYNIIYEMLEEVTDVLEGRAQAAVEEIFGTARILAKFPFEKTFAAGITVLDGRVARGDRVRVLRGEEVIGETIVSSLRVGKDVQSKVEKGREAGILFQPALDFLPGDVLLCHD